MLAYVIALVLRLFGRQVQFVAWHSPVTRTFEVLGGSPIRKAVLGSIIHGGTAQLLLAVVLHINGADSTASAAQLTLLYLAVAWLYIGPLLIWIYERFVLPYCVEHAADILTTSDAAEVQSFVCRRALGSWLGRAVLVLWTGFMAFLFYSTRSYAETFGIQLHSVSWWLLLLGVLVTNYYATFGIYFVLRSFAVTGVLCSKGWTLNPYHEDGRGGGGFIGYFAAATAAMFASGVLFAPLLFDAGNNSNDGAQIAIMLPLILYSALILLSFASPLVQVHLVINAHKRSLNAGLRSKAIEAMQAVAAKGLEEDKNKYQVYRQVVEDVRSIKPWPIGFLGASAGLLSTALPLAVAFVRDFLQPSQ